MQSTTNQQYVSSPLRPGEAGTGRSNEESLRRVQAALLPPIQARIKAGTRPTPLAPEKVRGENKAVIEIHQRGLELANQSSLVGSFYDFILGNIQETDAEKVSVMETFGDPHIFASGRFLRKYTFAGVCRTTPPKWDSDEPSLVVSQFLSFRVFYDQYLRASEQVKHRRFTRVIVDNDVYEGWVTTMNLGRAAENEQMVPFTFTLYGIKRSHRDEQKAMSLLNAFRVTTTGKRKFDFTRAQAALSDALGKLELSLHERQQTAQAESSLAVTTETDDNLVTKTIGYLRAVGSSQILSVSIPGELGKAISLEYGPAGSTPTPVHGSLAKTSEAKADGQPLILRVTSMVPFIDANQDADASSKTLTLSVPIKISAPTGSSVQLTVTLAARTGTVVTMDAVSVLYPHAPQVGTKKPAKIMPPGESPTLLPDVAGETAGEVIGAFDSDNEFPFILIVGVRATKGILLPEWFADPNPALTVDRIGAYDTERGSEASKQPLKISSGQSWATISRIKGDAETSSFTIEGRIRLNDFSLATRDSKISHLRVLLRLDWQGAWSSFQTQYVAFQFSLAGTAVSLYSDSPLAVYSTALGVYPLGRKLWAIGFEVRTYFTGDLPESIIAHFQKNVAFTVSVKAKDGNAGLGRFQVSATAGYAPFRLGGVRGDRTVAGIAGMGEDPGLNDLRQASRSVMHRMSATSKVTTVLQSFIYVGVEGPDPAVESYRDNRSKTEEARQDQGWIARNLEVRELTMAIAGETFPAELLTWKAPGL